MKRFLRYRLIAFFILATAVIGVSYTNCGRVNFDSRLNTEESLGGGGNNTGLDIPVDATTSCPAGQVPVGLSANFTPVCATPQNVASNVCPAGTALIGVGNGTVSCLSTTVYTQPGQICPVGSVMVSFTASGSVVCSSYSNTLSVSCPTGKVLTGIKNNAPVCEPLTVNTLICPTGQYLTGVANNQAQCQNIWWNTIPSLTCGNNQQLLGLNSANQGVCQDIVTTVPADQSCAAGAILKNKATPLACQNPPTYSTAWMCPAGTYPAAIGSNKITCQTAPAGMRTCPVGQYISGFLSGNVVCTPQSTTLPGFCPVGTYPVGVSNGSLVCANLNNTQSPTLVCNPGNQSLCLIPNGVGSMTCNSDGSAYSSCQPMSCFTGYALNGSTCTAIACVPAQSTACRVANGSGQSICSSVGQPGPCTVSQCDPGYVLQGTTCISQVCTPGTNTSCRIGAGTGIQTCQSNGLGYGACQIQSCDAGYSIVNGACNDTTAPIITLISTPANPTKGPSATTNFAVTDVGSGLASTTCKLDSAAAVPCTTTFSSTTLVSGSHTLLITAKDNGGNTATKTVTWVTDLCTPQRACPIANGTGVFQCTGNGDFGPCTVNTCTSGYTADTATNTCVLTSCPAGQSIVNGACVDNTPPVITILTKPASPTIGNSAFTFTATDAGSQIAALECKLDAAAYSACSSPLNLGTLSVGSHTLIIRARDSAGNESSASTTWSVMNCVPGSTTTCSIPNATAVNTCAADGSGYGACLVTSCATRYQKSGNSCVYVPNGCALPWGGTIASGQSVAAYAAASVAYNQSCSAQTRTCNDGVLSGSYAASGCQVQAPPSELWTWTSNFVAISCTNSTMACDGFQQVNCAGTGCPGSRYLSYVVFTSYPFTAPNTPGSTQTYRPPYIGPGSGSYYGLSCDNLGFYSMYISCW